MTPNDWLIFVAFPVAAYLAASVPFAVLIARAHGVDLRKSGSGNVGATNVARVLGRKWGYLCFVLDVSKGLVPVLLAGLYLRGVLGGLPPDACPAGGCPLHLDAAECRLVLSAARQGAWILTAFAAIAGHVFSLFLKFRGGKGVATSLGVILGMYPYFTGPGLAAFGVWLLAAALWRYVSLASILAAAAFPLFFMAACPLAGWPMARLWPLLAFATAMSVLIIYRHRANIARLRAGAESKIGRKNAERGASS